MTTNNVFQTILDAILSHRLASALSGIENYLLSHPRQHDMEQLNAIKADYRLLTDYWIRGFEDPQRQALHQQLLRRAYVLLTNIILHARIRETSFLMSVYNRPRQSRKDWSLSALRRDLENFVSSVALLQLEPENTRKERQQQLYQEHQFMMSDLFDYIWTSRLWSDSLAHAFEELLLSPTIDVVDQQLILSAITLSARNDFGFNKFSVLVKVYREATDERLRQRALVGWVLCLDSRLLSLYPEMRQMVDELTADERCRRELLELQMQLAYCMQAERDTRTVHDEIIPDLMRHNHLRVSPQGKVEEVDEDTLNEILHPEAAEQDMARLEEQVGRMADMQRAGSDIFFGSFAQMKRFRFFDDISNWFVPFYAEHPGIANCWGGRGTLFLRLMAYKSVLCDGDKYSLLLGFQSVLDRMPQSTVELIERGEAQLAGAEADAVQLEQPAFIRRSYLQNLYRFFRLYPMRQYFSNPFASEQAPVFFADPIYQGTPLEAHFPEVASFMMKRDQTQAAEAVLGNMTDTQQAFQRAMLLGALAMRRRQHEEAFAHFCDAHTLEADNHRALLGMARAGYAAEHYQQVLPVYAQLLEQQPDNTSYQLRHAACLAMCGKAEEALEPLFKLNYEHPDDDDVKRTLAWALADVGRTDQASRIYEQLLQQPQPLPLDMLNYGFCLWFSADKLGAVGMFRQYGADGDEQSVEAAFRAEEPRLQRHGITSFDIQLMVDMVAFQA